MAARLGMMAGLLFQAALVAQDGARLTATAERLADDGQRLSALHDLRGAGDAGARAAFAAFARARADGDDPLPFATALAALGPSTVAVTAPLIAAIDGCDEPLRSHLLRALANGALRAGGAERDAILTATKRWAERGALYSPAADAPTFAWYEYVRLIRRLQVADAGGGPEELEAALVRLERERGTGMLAGADGADLRHPHARIEAFGAHGQREWLEAVGELTIACVAPPAGAIEELAAYLRHTPPRPPRVITEHCAGIGENAPNDLPGVRWPTKWLYDEWHFPVARAVLAHSRVDDDRALALAHLLFSSDVGERLGALERVRTWPAPWQPFHDGLRTALGDADRRVARAALVTLGLAPELPPTVRDGVQAHVDGDDAELRALAKAALRPRRR